MSVSANVQAKAARLLAEGRVAPDGSGPVRLFEVVGDTEKYWPVVVTASRRYCPCKRWRESGQPCSHLEAAISWVLAEAEEAQGHPNARFVAYCQALAERRASEAEAADDLFRRLGA